MRVLAAMIVFVTGLTVSGCMSPERRSGRDRDDRRQPAENREPRKEEPFWMEGAGASSSNSNRNKNMPTDAMAKAARETVIAGEVVEGVDRKRLPGRTYIVVKPAEELVSDSPVKPGNVGVETDDDGFFYMSGLIAGKTYILSATREYDGKKIAAEMMIKPPAANLRLELSDSKLSSVSPTPPPPIGMTGPFAPPPALEAASKPPETSNGPDRGWEPGAAPANSGTVPSRPFTPRPENVAALNPMSPPTAAIRTAPPPGVNRPAQPEIPNRLPVNRVPNFVLSDVTGSDWEFRYSSGRLVLLDFWSTTCQPCMRAVPGMKRLQANYGNSGLEIVGIACEPDAPFNQRAKPVDEVARRKEMNYKVYLERDRHVGEVQRLFNVQWVPTLVLLDRQGNILWRGGATDTDFARLEEIVRTYLTRRN